MSELTGLVFSKHSKTLDTLFKTDKKGSVDHSNYEDVGFESLNEVSESDLQMSGGRKFQEVVATTAKTFPPKVQDLGHS